ncbi:MAG: hypothetical protein U1E51_21845 [Candidatus Binatia bacterium]|nr:hypothetical protein [Candidatus Binatia bacterium]
MVTKLTQDKKVEIATLEAVVVKEEKATVKAPPMATAKAFMGPSTFEPPKAPFVSALQHVEAWWEEVAAAAPRPDQMSFATYAKQQWDKLAERLRGR